MFSTDLKECPSCHMACPLTRPQCPMGAKWAAQEKKRKAEEAAKAQAKEKASDN